MKGKQLYFIIAVGISYLLTAIWIAKEPVFNIWKNIDEIVTQENIAPDKFPFLEQKEDSKQELTTVETEKEPEEEIIIESNTTEEILVEEQDVPEIKHFETVSYDYFDDALFIGDSRTVGLKEYGGLSKATFFADSGMSVYRLEKERLEVDGKGKLSLDEVLSTGNYGKIYLMIGMNEIGYSYETSVSKYHQLVEKIRQYQPEAVLFLCANLHVSEEQSETDPLYNNKNINIMNEMIAKLQDGYTSFYIDINEKFDDENGNLDKQYTSDSAHVYGKYYMEWIDWLCTKGING